MDLLQITGAIDVTLPPRVYYGGVKVNCSCTVTFLPGIFVMAGGGFTKTRGQQRGRLDEKQMLYQEVGSHEPVDVSLDGSVGYRAYGREGLYRGIRKSFA